MAKRKQKKLNKKITSIIIAIILAIVAFLQGQGVLPDVVNPNVDGKVYLHIIDVGQGSSTLIQQGHKGILIDAGEIDCGETVAEYVNSCGINELSYVVASHPHSDHIGGLPYVLKKIEADEVIMPEIDEENLPTTRVYENLLDTILDKNINASYCNVGSIYKLGDIRLEILGPCIQTDDLNNMSAICRISVGETDVMVLGDAEASELKSVYKYGGNFEAEILIMGHHGSRSGLQKDFLAAVNPSVAIISCGKNNSYGHPHDETISYLMKNDIDYWRTDYSGNIVYCIDTNGFERLEDR